MRGSRLLLGWLLAGVSVLVGMPGRSQVVPDRTLGDEASVVRSGVDVEGVIADLIEGGATRGSNLFHSFLDFNIGEAERVYFDSPAGVESILGRVTGGNLSNINGLLGTTGASDAALILMNPNGVVFGENARLDVQGAFVATTAAGVQIGETGLFSAIDPENDNLLSVKPSAYFFNDLQNTGDIEVFGSELQVPNREVLMLLGRNVLVDGGRLSAREGQVYLGTASGTGTVVVEDKQLIIPDEIQQGVVRLENEAVVDVRRATAGDIQVVAGEIEILSGSDFLGGIDASSGRLGAQAGDIRLNAAGTVMMSGNSQIRNTVEADGVGDAGDVLIDANAVRVLDGARINVSTFGRGDTGGIKISAQDALFEGVDGDGNPSGMFAVVQEDAQGQGEAIEVVADTVSVVDGAIIATLTGGDGDGGDVLIRASDRVLLSSFEVGTEATSVISSGVEERGVGQGGSITIVTDSLIVEGNSQLNSSTGGVGDSGNVDITASSVAVTDGGLVGSNTGGIGDAGDVLIQASDRVLFSGFREEDGVNLGSAASSATNPEAIGEGGDIDIVTQTLVVEDGAFLSASTSGTGDAGDINVVADSVAVTDGAFLSASTFGTGDAGDISLQVEDNMLFSGLGTEGIGSFASSSVTNDGTGQGGDIKITTGSLMLEDTAQLSTSVSGEGNAGNIEVTAADSVVITGGSFLISSSDGRGDSGDIVVEADNSVLLSGLSENGRVSSSIRSSVGFSGFGEGGDIEITTGSLTVENGASIVSGTFGRGDAGNISLRARENILFSNDTGEQGDGVLTTVASGVLSDGEGNGGSIEIAADAVSFLNGASVNTATFGVGNAGSVSIRAHDRLLFSGRNANFSSGINSSIVRGAVGRGGDILLVSNSLMIENEADLISNTAGTGNAGSIDIAADSVSLANSADIDSSTSGTGNAGNIQVVADSVAVTDSSSITAVTSGDGNAGNISIQAEDRVSIGGANGGSASVIFSSVFDEGVGQGGDVEIVAGSLDIQSGGAVITGTSGEGDAGNVSIQVRDSVVIESLGTNGAASSAIISMVGDSGRGQGGDVEIAAHSLRVVGAAQINTSTLGKGSAGNVSIRVVEDAVFDATEDDGVFGNGVYSIVGNEAVGVGGDIEVEADSVLLRGGAGLNVSTFGEGDAGNITVNVSSTLTMDGTTPVEGLLTGLATSSFSDGGAGGDIVVDASKIRFSAGAGMTAQTDSSQPGGDITINAEEIELVTGGQIVSTSNGEGAAGSLRISGSHMLLDEGVLTTESVAADGGNISVDLTDSLVLRNGSQISATAGTSEASGNGGNVDIAAPVVVAIPIENSDITANAFSGTGGRVRLQSRAVFGSQEREMLTTESDITASSDRGVNGVVVVESPDTETVESNVVDLPQRLVDDELLASSCIARDEDAQGKFVLTGHDLPQHPVNASSGVYATGNVRSIRADNSASVQEPQTAYRLADNRLVLSHRCEG